METNNISSVNAEKAFNLISSQLPESTLPEVGIILGSGLRDFAKQLSEPHEFAFSQLAGFPVTEVQGHNNSLTIGQLHGCTIACLQGRAHYYEGFEPEHVNTLIRTLKLLGCKTVLITNAAGSLNMDVGPGGLMLIKDHINFQPFNPLRGPNDDNMGSRFFPLHDAYDVKLRQGLQATAKRLDIPLTEGVYLSTLGPSFETPAEILAFRTLGADAVGMSTVAEVISARHCGLRVAVVSAITNYAAGLSEEAITHEGTLHYGNLTLSTMTTLLSTFIKDKLYAS